MKTRRIELWRLALLILGASAGPPALAVSPLRIGDPGHGDLTLLERPSRMNRPLSFGVDGQISVIPGLLTPSLLQSNPATSPLPVDDTPPFLLHWLLPGPPHAVGAHTIVINEFMASNI